MDKPRIEKEKSMVNVEIKVDKVEDEHEVSVTDFDIPGVTKVVLSPITQQAIGCVVGEDMTSEKPWIYIKKEIFEDNLDINEDSSEFLPIKQEILEYPEKDLLLGYDKSLVEEKEEFYICVTTDAKDIVLNMLEKERAEMRERLKSCVQKTPRKWRSMGSEQEIDENVIQSLRPLIEIEVETKYPLYDTKIKFSMSSVEVSADDCIDLLPSRIPINNVFRKRVDKGIQVAADITLNEVQTNPTYPLNTWTQYHYEYAEKQFNHETIDRAENIINDKSEDLCDMIRVNEFINLHTNDYASLVNHLHVPFSIDTDEVISFHDVLSCKGKKVSSISWHPLMSGIVAVAYVRSPQHYTYNHDLPLIVENDAIYTQNLVLVWSYTDSLTPKLYLQAHREVNSVSFCHYNPNILIGGCTNGQIVIWDITNKIKEVEVSEQLTPQQEKHRVIVQGYMNWIKNVKDIALIQPTAVTNLGQGHKASVTDISWLSADYEITRYGLIEKLENGNGNIHFFTCGLDGAVYLWDLKQKPDEEVVNIQPRKVSKRFLKQPSALSLEFSDLMVLNKMFIPQYKLKVQDPISKRAIPITNMEMDCPTFIYTPVNPETLQNRLQRTYFSMSKSDVDFDFKPQLTLTTSTGQVLKCTWKGYEIDSDQKLNSETFQMDAFQNVHDGPIKSCSKNPFLTNVVLTVGGSVFVTWNLESTESPILYRKSNVRYISGIWSSYHPGVVIIARRDTNIEIWDLNQQSKSPVRIVQLSGNIFIDGFTDTSKLHVRKNMCCTADALGALRFYKIPDYLSRSQAHQVKYASEELALTERRRKLYKKWLTEWKAKYLAPKEQKKVTPSYIYGKKVEEHLVEMDDKTKSLTKKREENFDKMTSLRWIIKEKKVMYEILLQKKNMDMELINQKIEPMDKMKEKERVKKQKLKALLAQKDKISQNAENKLCMKTIITQRKEISVSLSEEDVIQAKKCYINAYESIEQKTLQHISSNQFTPSFDWKNMINKGRERRSALNTLGYINNTRRKRYMEQKLNCAAQHKLEEKVSLKSHSGDLKTSLKLKTGKTIQNMED